MPGGFNTSFLSLPRVGALYGAETEEIQEFVYEQSLRVCVRVSGVEVDRVRISEAEDGQETEEPLGKMVIQGPLGLFGVDLLPLFHGEEQVKLFEVRANDGVHTTIVMPKDGYPVTLKKLCVARNDLAHFERLTGISPKPPSGRTTRYDWDGMYCALIHHLADSTLPSKQTELVRFCLDWFSQHGDAAPDESSVKKKVSRLYKERV